NGWVASLLVCSFMAITSEMEQREVQKQIRCLVLNAENVAVSRVGAEQMWAAAHTSVIAQTRYLACVPRPPVKIRAQNSPERLRVGRDASWRLFESKYSCVSWHP